MTISSLLLPSLLLLSAAESRPLDLRFEDGASGWRVVLDGVMGGRSSGRLSQPEAGVLRFEGNLSLENNGGFSQIRTNVPGAAFEGADGIEFRVRGDGRAYLFNLRCSDVRLMAGSFQAAFETEADVWRTIRIPFDDFRLHSFGRLIENPPPLVSERIESIGLTLADKQAGPFRIDVGSIRSYSRLREILAKNAGPEPVAPTSDPVVALIERAVERGAPLFNEGNPDACAAVYEIAMTALLELGGDRLQPEERDRIEKALAKAAGESESRTRAWTYRRAMDEIYNRLASPRSGSSIASRR